VNQYLTIPSYVDTLKQGGNPAEQLTQIKEYLVDNKPLSFNECVRWARLRFEVEFSNEIRQLLYSLPRDLVSHYFDPAT
jgi:ubiquitin-activating enzyme E1